MKPIYFNPGDAVKKAFDLLKENFLIHVFVFFVAFAFQMVFAAWGSKNMLLFLLQILVSIVASLFITGYAIKVVRHEKFGLNEVIAQSVTLKKILNYALYSIIILILIYGIVFFILLLTMGTAGMKDLLKLDVDFGQLSLFSILMFLILIAVIIYLSIRLMFVVYFIVDENIDFIGAMSKSWEITRGHVGNLFILYIFAVLLMILGFLMFIIGIFITAPIVYFALAVAYETLRKKLYPAENEIAQTA